jgi:hypothetical protein
MGKGWTARWRSRVALKREVYINACIGQRERPILEVAEMGEAEGGAQVLAEL